MFTKETYARAKNNTIAGLCRSSSKEMRLIPTLFRPCVPLHQAPPLPVWALSAITPNILARHGRHAFVSSWVSLLHPFARLTQNFTQLSFVSPRITAHGYHPPYFYLTCHVSQRIYGRRLLESITRWQPCERRVSNAQAQSRSDHLRRGRQCRRNRNRRSQAAYVMTSSAVQSRYWYTFLAASPRCLGSS
jgi:hypothetical protein